LSRLLDDDRHAARQRRSVPPVVAGDAGAEAAGATTQPPPGHPRFPRIDAVRAIAALLIVAYHVAFLTGSLAHGWTSNVTPALQVGVPIFFAISGFVLYRPMVASRHGAPGRSIAAYGRSRALRILPAYWVVLTVAAVYPTLVGVFTHDWWRYYGLVQIYTPERQFLGLGVAWSLCIEITFYVLLPLYALAMSRLAGTGPAWVRTELAVLAVLSVASAAAFVTWSMLSILVTFAWFAAGMSGAVLSVAGARPRERSSRAGPWVLAGAVGALCLVAAASNPLGLGPSATKAAYMVLTAGIASLILARATQDTAGLGQRLLSWRWLGSLGVVSYGIYLYHLPVLVSVHKLGLEDLAGGWPALGYIVVGVPVTVALASLSYFAIERPALRLARRGRARRGFRDPAAR
jgi:peptidoglycan/LPS O-acetylase OafA/YrhL